MSKHQRLAAIVDILGEQPVDGQERLRVLLAERGFEISQSSLSRDLKELGAHRQRMSDGLFGYVVPSERPPVMTEELFRLRFRTSVTGVRRAEFVILVFTPPGEAQMIGRLLDSASPAEIVGTVAGDDTVICITGGETEARALETRFAAMVR